MFICHFKCFLFSFSFFLHVASSTEQLTSVDRRLPLRQRRQNSECGWYETDHVVLYICVILHHSRTAIYIFIVEVHHVVLFVSCWLLLLLFLFVFFSCRFVELNHVVLAGDECAHSAARVVSVRLDDRDVGADLGSHFLYNMRVCVYIYIYIYHTPRNCG